MAFGPTFELGHTLEACLFIHPRRLEVVARHPNTANTSTASFFHKGAQQFTRITTSTISLIDPHLLEFGNASPRIASSRADYLSRVVPNYESQPLAIMASGRMSIVFVEAIFYRIDLIRS